MLLASSRDVGIAEPPYVSRWLAQCAGAAVCGGVEGAADGVQGRTRARPASCSRCRTVNSVTAGVGPVAVMAPHTTSAGSSNRVSGALDASPRRCPPRSACPGTASGRAGPAAGRPSRSGATGAGARTRRPTWLPRDPNAAARVGADRYVGAHAIRRRRGDGGSGPQVPVVSSVVSSLGTASTACSRTGRSSNSPNRPRRTATALIGIGRFCRCLGAMVIPARGRRSVTGVRMASLFRWITRAAARAAPTRGASSAEGCGRVVQTSERISVGGRAAGMGARPARSVPRYGRQGYRAR